MLYIETNYTILDNDEKNTTLRIELDKEQYHNIIKFIYKEMFVNLVVLKRTIVIYSISIIEKGKDSSDIHNYEFYMNAMAKNGRRDILPTSKEYTICLTCEGMIYPFKLSTSSGLIRHPDKVDNIYVE